MLLRFIQTLFALYILRFYDLFKTVLRIIISTENRDSCRTVFKKIHILPIQSQYSYLLLIFVVNNMVQFKRNSAIHNTITRQSVDLFLPSSKLSTYKKETYNMGIKVFNNLLYK